jgi:hypothetical protein
MDDTDLIVNEERAKGFTDPAKKAGISGFNPYSQCAYDKILKRYVGPPGWVWLWGFRFRLIDLNVDELVVEESHEMFHGFCRIPYKLTIHFQATAQHLREFYRNEFITDINERIKSKYGKLLTVEVAEELDEFGRKALRPEGITPPSDVPAPDITQKEAAETEPAPATVLLPAGEHAAEGVRAPAGTPAGNGSSSGPHASDSGLAAAGAKLDLFDSMSQAEAEIEKRIRRYFRSNKIVCHVKCDLRPPVLKRIELESIDRDITIDSIYQKLFEQFIKREGEFKRSAIEKLHSEKRKYQKKVAEQERENKKSIDEQERENKRAELEAAGEMAGVQEQLRTREATDAERLNEHNKLMRRHTLDGAKTEASDRTDRELFLMREDLRRAVGERELIASDGDKAELERSLKLNSARLEHELSLVEAEGVRARLLAENCIEYERRSELFKLLPALFEKMVGYTQQIEHLSILQIDSSQGSGGDGDGRLNSALLNPMVQIAQSIYILKELQKLSESPRS